MKRLFRSMAILLAVVVSINAKETISIAAFPWMTVSYKGEAHVFNASLDKLGHDDPFFHAQGDRLPYIKVLEIIPNAKDNDLYSILFTIAEGGDSRYEFYLEGDCITPAFVLHADHLDFPGDGYIIARGSMNQMFMISKKYKISNGRIKEISQPYYAVDIDSEATCDMDIFGSKRMKQVLDTIEKGEKVSVLLTEFKKKHVYYLVRSERGLTGWIRIEQETWVDETPVKDLYFHGD